MPLIFDTVLVDPTLLVAVRRLLDTKREDIHRMPMLLDVSRAFAEVLINFLINEKLDALEVHSGPFPVRAALIHRPFRPFPL
jgi:hypothetical protein